MFDFQRFITLDGKTLNVGEIKEVARDKMIVTLRDEQTVGITSYDLRAIKGSNFIVQVLPNPQHMVAILLIEEERIYVPVYYLALCADGKIRGVMLSYDGDFEVIDENDELIPLRGYMLLEEVEADPSSFVRCDVASNIAWDAWKRAT